jgi:hypothetical protein
MHAAKTIIRDIRLIAAQQKHFRLMPARLFSLIVQPVPDVTQAAVHKGLVR